MRQLLTFLLTKCAGKSYQVSLLVILSGSVILPAAAADQRIVLGDGSELRGEVVSMQNGVYTVRSSTLGTIRVESQNIRSISAVSVGNDSTSTESASSTTASASTIQSIQSSIVGNSGIMSNMMKLQQDPAMKAVLADKEVMRAVQNLDLQALARHPKIKALMNSPEMKSITSQVQ